MITGRYKCRVLLPGGAGWQACSSTHVLVPLWEQPKICVLDWDGNMVATLGHSELGLGSTDRGFLVSPIHEGRFSFLVRPPGRHCINTYQVSISLVWLMNTDVVFSYYPWEKFQMILHHHFYYYKCESLLRGRQQVSFHWQLVLLYWFVYQLPPI